MFNWLRKNNKNEEIEYSFIWYKEMKNGNKTFYTQPFRTRVKAKSFEEAKEKATRFALDKMKLIIVSENEYEKTDLSNFEKGFDEIHKIMDRMFKNFKK